MNQKGEKGDGKEERIHFRVDAKTKRKLERAASLEGMSLSQFIMKTMVREATQVERYHHTVELGEMERGRFIEAVMARHGPSEALTALFEGEER